ncbi:uncharacterized protein LOC131670308 [Phymastichus coffea]|uniref:uncharacterized protein LOC131670308 n=1 Tax=Phymastichus coffea TaxID=108790 RepID=UPI00273C0AF9|nr:uncharacterized protein LOC131670308 [Phymastichus coffea]
MDEEHGSPTKPSAATSQSSLTPTLNLMEQLLLAKIERSEDGQAGERAGRAGRAARARSGRLLRADSMDSQTSASTFSSALSAESASNNRYCSCDDCLLGISDSYAQPKRNKPTVRHRGDFASNVRNRARRQSIARVRASTLAYRERRCE